MAALTRIKQSVHVKGIISGRLKINNFALLYFSYKPNVAVPTGASYVVQNTTTLTSTRKRKNGLTKILVDWTSSSPETQTVCMAYSLLFRNNCGVFPISSGLCQAPAPNLFTMLCVVICVVIL